VLPFVPPIVGAFVSVLFGLFASVDVFISEFPDAPPACVFVSCVPVSPFCYVFAPEYLFASLPETFTG
jgi:hypothetical protein